MHVAVEDGKQRHRAVADEKTAPDEGHLTGIAHALRGQVWLAQARQSFDKRHRCPQRTAKHGQHDKVDDHRVEQQPLVGFQQVACRAEGDPRQRHALHHIPHRACVPLRLTQPQQ